MIWRHPTGNNPKTVSLVCLGPSSRNYVSACLGDNLSPAVCAVDETWTLNRGVTLFRHDLAFVMDHIQGEADAYPNYGAALWRHDRPIITSDANEGWPPHVHRYPFAEITHWLDDLINQSHSDWWHNSVAYIVCYAAFIGVKELRVFGADYTNHSNGVVENGHANVAYWVGVMEQVGLVVKPESSSGFLNANQRDYIYGYQNDPRQRYILDEAM